MSFQNGWDVLVLGCFGANTKTEQLDPFFETPPLRLPAEMSIGF